MLKTLLTTFALSTMLISAATAQSMTVGVQNLPPWLDPGKDFSNNGSQIYYNTFDPLILKDYSQAGATFKPGLATAWEQLSPTEFQVTLREGVKFQNGDLMTAEDVVFSFERVLQDMTPEYAGIHRQFFDNFASVEKIDDATVKFTTTKPEPLFEVLLNTSEASIVPKNYIAGLTGDKATIEPSDFDAFMLAPVGTGPYAISSFQPGENLVWTRFDGYWGDKAALEEVTLRRIPELATRVTALANGEVDLITNVPPDQLDTIGSNPALKVVGNVTPLFHVIFFNTRNPAMANPKLRQALGMGIDRNLLNEALWGNQAKVPNTHSYEQFGELYDTTDQTFEYNPEKAKELLAEAGYDGSVIRFDTDPVYYTNGLLAAQAIQEMWAEIGVKAEINVTTKWTGPDADMMVRNWSNPMYFADPAGSFGVMWSPKGSGSEMAWTPNEAYPALWDKFRYSTDLAVRKEAYSEIMAYVKEEMPFVVLYQPYESYGMRQDVTWAPLPGHIPYVLDFRAGSVTVK
ncbi:ABC transporter substrate-binding protein [Devosia epidermidihirudinis]|uniref:ABC transporter substrate-binding protein n=1 Tax=Devosia epidermidihirudinis TaxID=1293439 RepID=A0A0F5QCN9_9HYPH|nr:ABC transporter substrate-binding protein [Devosia epidermidihirudinis]KKC38767.1 ABC transporter substrate-binding protein [Devosia epidermidihirudinis]